MDSMPSALPALSAQSTDTEVFLAIRSQHVKALDLLYDRYGKLVYSIAFRMLNNVEEAEEITQETFLRLWQRSEIYQPDRTAALQQQLKDTNTELARLRSELQANQAAVAVLSDPSTQVQALVGTMPNPTDKRLATARMLMKPGDRQVTLVAQNLPKLPAEQIYRLWSVADTSAAPMYCGEFRQDDSGTAQWTAPDAACTKNPAQMIVTLDAPGDPITSAGPLVMKSFS